MKSWLFLLSLALVACQSTVEHKVPQPKAVKNQTTNVETVSFINPYYMAHFLEDVDIKYYPFLFNKLDKNIVKANYYVKNGRLKNNLHEKYTYLFNSHGNINSLSHFSQLTYHQPYTDFNFIYNEKNDVIKTDVINYMKTFNLPPYYYYSDTTFSYVAVPKSENFFDTTYFYPSSRIPDLIYTRSNNKTIETQFFVPVGTSISDIKTMINEQQSTLKIDDFTYIFVTYTDNNLPIETYEMNSNLDFAYKVKSWEYNRQWLPIKYQEFLTSSLIKELTIEYNSDNLPDYIRLNKKVFNTYYEFDHAQ